MECVFVLKELQKDHATLPFLAFSKCHSDMIGPQAVYFLWQLFSHLSKPKVRCPVVPKSETVSETAW